MPFFNGTIATKKLQNIIDTFSENVKKWTEDPPGYSYFTDIETKYKKVFQPS